MDGDTPLSLCSLVGVRIEVDAILFDNDGVLVDSHEQVDRSWRQLAEEFDLEPEKLVVEAVGARSADTLGRHLPPDRLDAAVARLEDIEVDLAAATQPLAGAIELIGQIPDHRWAIATSASRRLAEARWKGAGIAHPHATVTADDVERGKPDPEPFVAGARALGVDPTRCVVFEDSAPGGAAGMAAGAAVIAVGGQAWPVEPVARVRDLTEVSIELSPEGSLVVCLDSDGAGG